MKKYNATGLLLFSLLFVTCTQLRTLEDVVNSKINFPRPERPESPGENGDEESSEDEAVGLLKFPVTGKSRKHIISSFGEPRGGGTRIHEGIDIGAPLGTPVVAAVDGVVTEVKEGGNGGKQVWMRDKRSWRLYYYAHLHSQSVRPGQRVIKGDELGTVGNTGNASAGSPHLHFGIYEPGHKPIDPLPLMP